MKGNEMGDINHYKWLKSTETIDYSVRDGVARITLNRPEQRNAISEQMAVELHQALLESDDRRDVNVVVLAGKGRDFCSGYDLSGRYGKGGEAAAPGEGDSAYRGRTTMDDDVWQLERALDRRLFMFDMHKPVIAKVQGYCLAGGTDLAFLCDMIVAAEDAKIGFPAARANGTPPTQLWLHMVGPQWAKRMLFTGDMLTGRDAARIGLVLDAVPPEQLDAEVDELARRVASVDADILAAHKRAVNAGLELMGARTLQRTVAELDARAHLGTGPRRTKFKADVKTVGLRDAFKLRDAPFGDGMITLKAAGG
jgi:enoyl-CoA hydratase